MNELCTGEVGQRDPISNKRLMGPCQSKAAFMVTIPVENENDDIRCEEEGGVYMLKIMCERHAAGYRTGDYYCDAHDEHHDYKVKSLD